MKSGRTLRGLVDELERQMQSKRDYVVSGKVITANSSKPVEDVKSETYVTINPPSGSDIEGGRFKVTDRAHGQLATRTGIPKPYYDKMRVESPELLDRNVNHWLQQQKSTVRTLDGQARAFLSDSYRRLDNYDLMERALPVFRDLGADCDIKSMELTDSHLYLQIVTPRVTAEVRRGDIVQAGIILSNSEIGAGAIKIQPLVYRLVCENGMISNIASMRRAHLGGKLAGGMDNGEFVFKMLTDETRRATDEAIWRQVQDVIRGSFEHKSFTEIVEQMTKVANNEFGDDNAEDVVKMLGDEYGVNEGERKGILRELIKSEDFSQYGLMNAVTYQAQKVDDYDRSIDLQRLGGQLIEDATWKDIDKKVIKPNAKLQVSVN